jgi:polar amino acid transport system substrate-binding protein
MILYYVVFGSWDLSGVWVSIIGFSILFACSVYDMITDGIAAVGKKQCEGARALGYNKNQTLFLVLLPQAARHIFPRYKNEVISLIKETSIVGYIAVSDLTKMSDIVRNRTYEAFFPLISTAVIYFAITALLIAAVNRVEIKFDPKRRTSQQIAAGLQIKEY